MKRWRAILCSWVVFSPMVGKFQGATAPRLLAELTSPILWRGDNYLAFRDPLLLWQQGEFILYFSYVREEEDHLIYWYVAESRSSDLRTWTAPRLLTPKNQNLNYASPGSVFRFQNEWIICYQSYPIVGFHRGDKLRFADDRARLFLSRSHDLKSWSEPELILVKGPTVTGDALGKMIDPYIFPDKDLPGKWWCFYKQNGNIHCAWSLDLARWQTGTTDLAHGENPCVVVSENKYRLYYAPANGVGTKESGDLIHWQEPERPLTLGQADWPWAETRLTAGYVADFRQVPGVERYLMVFHGSGPGKVRTELQENANSSIGIAWSRDLRDWQWPGKVAETK